MLPRSARIAHLAMAAAMVFLSVDIARSDDTEVFEAIPPAGTDTRPNVLLIIDTSGSMRGDVKTQEDWNPNVDFDGSCADDYVYWQAANSTALPSCSGQNQNRIRASSFVCQAAAATLASAGQVQIAEAIQWRRWATPRVWGALGAGQDRFVECRQDHPTTGTHSGEAANDGLHPRDGNNGPFSDSNEINWTTAGAYTFYTGNRLNYLRNTGLVSRTRIQVVQQVAKGTLDQLLDGSVNIGLMRYDRRGDSDTQGGYILHEIGPIETVRAAIKTQIDGLSATSWTPLTETLFEAFRYFTGGEVYFGNTATATSVAASRLPAPNTGTYKSPMGTFCQPNFIILLTDGEPTRDGSADAAIEALPNFENRTLPAGPAAPACSDNVAVSPDYDGTGVCLDDIAQYMFRRPDLSDPTGRNIRTFTVGFGPGVDGSTNILNAAVAGGGTYYTAADTAGLTTALTNVFNEIFEDNLTFTAPAVSVNAFNRTQNLRDLFFTVFQPTNAFHWPGNLKKYKLGEDGDIEDRDQANAVDPTTGFFNESSRSYWSATADGAAVEQGGAAYRIPAPDARNVYTDIAAYQASPIRSLTNDANAVIATNPALTAPVLGLPAVATATQISDLINWARGVDVDDVDANPATTQRFVMGDPLHARAATVIYGGTEESPNIVVFTATNDGYLHAIDGRDNAGNELWSFIPSELLPRLNSLRTADPPNSKQYGLDANIRAHKIDVNGNGVVDGADRVILFFGMGRGGSNYYAVDVTSQTSPRLLWRRGPGDATNPLTGLAQTWSTPVVGDVVINKVKKLVIIFGGGYDPTQDNVAHNTDDVGNRIFMLDALTGALLWSAGPTGSSADFVHSKMTYSIPADMRVADMNLDGLLDRMYVADMGARVWRFDIDNKLNTGASTLVAGGVIASLGAASDSGSTAVSDARRFYASPDVVLLKSGGRSFLNIAIGSGYRGHPLDLQIRDRFYGLRDYSPFASMSQEAYDAFPVITEADTKLIDVTTNLNPLMPNDARGWKIELRDPAWQGEKVFADSRTLGGNTLFTTFAPVNNTVTQGCAAQSGTNRLYCVKAFDGRPCNEQRFVTLQQNGIAPGPVIILPPKRPPCVGSTCPPPPEPCTGPDCQEKKRDCEIEGNCPIPCVGAECINMDLESDAGRTFWNAPPTDGAD